MRLQVAIKGAKGLKNLELGPGGLSDSFCVCSAGEAPASAEVAGALNVQTKVVNNCLDPVWGYSGILEWDGRSDLFFSVWDSNTSRKDALMGKVSLAQGKVESGFAGTLPLDPDGTVEVSVQEASDATVAAHEAAAAAATARREDKSQPSLQRGQSSELSTLLEQNDLLMWTFPLQSGAMLFGVDLFFLVFFLFTPSPTAVATKLTFTLIALGGALRVMGMPTSACPELRISDKSIQNAADTVVVSLSKSAYFVRYITSWRSHSDTCKVLATLYVLGSVSRWLNMFMVAFVVFNLVFIVPVQLRKQSKVIEEKIQPQVAKITEQKDKLFAMIPKYADVASKDD